jgi:uncharacterized protein
MTAELLAVAERITQALERLSPPPPDKEALAGADAYQWQASLGRLMPVPRVAHVDIGLLRGVDHQKKLVLDNTVQFARGHEANNVMLWGARGMGKSSLVKAAHAWANAQTGALRGQGLALIEIQRDELATLPALLALLRESPRRFIVFCDDLSFEHQDADYKSLKSVLDGGIMGRPENVVFYATSNRRHLMPRDMMENERGSAINPDEAIEEKVSLSDRFGLWIGVHRASQDVFLDMVDAYAQARGIALPRDELHARANVWSMGRGGRSGRVAVQFITDLAAELAQQHG